MKMKDTSLVYDKLRLAYDINQILDYHKIRPNIEYKPVNTEPDLFAPAFTMIAVDELQNMLNALAEIRHKVIEVLVSGN
jgi:hypothetical protein